MCMCCGVLLISHPCPANVHTGPTKDDSDDRSKNKTTSASFSQLLGSVVLHSQNVWGDWSNYTQLQLKQMDLLGIEPQGPPHAKRMWYHYTTSPWYHFWWVAMNQVYTLFTLFLWTQSAWLMGQIPEVSETKDYMQNSWSFLTTIFKNILCDTRCHLNCNYVDNLKVLRPSAGFSHFCPAKVHTGLLSPWRPFYTMAYIRQARLHRDVSAKVTSQFGRAV